jgi:putative chitinase
MAQGLGNRLENIIGCKMPIWVFDQLMLRSEQTSKTIRGDQNQLYIGNKTAWVRLISSVNIKDEVVNYFKTATGLSITNSEDLAKGFVLFGGTSAYEGGKYGLKSGLGKGGSYGILGDAEIREYGYRAFPGITSAKIETQGRLGSVRAATIEFKVNDKLQLDIIDALYFKYGFSMFIEWGNTFYYKKEDQSGALHKSEDNSIDPFKSGMDKDSIRAEIIKATRESEGNYDAMLGIVTNFTFSMNVDGGYDCTLRLMSLGVLAESMKANIVYDLPNVHIKELRKLIDTANQFVVRDAVNTALATANDVTIKENYPKCVQTFGAPTVGKDGSTWAIQGSGNYSRYRFYKNNKAFDTVDKKTVDYKCNGDQILIDGKSIELTYDEFLKKYSSDTTIAYSNLSSNVKWIRPSSYAKSRDVKAEEYTVVQGQDVRAPIDIAKTDFYVAKTDVPEVDEYFGIRRFKAVLSDKSPLKLTFDFSKIENFISSYSGQTQSGQVSIRPQQSPTTSVGRAANNAFNTTGLLSSLGPGQLPRTDLFKMATDLSINEFRIFSQDRPVGIDANILRLIRVFRQGKSTRTNFDDKISGIETTFYYRVNNVVYNIKFLFSKKDTTGETPINQEDLNFIYNNAYAKNIEYVAKGAQYDKIGLYYETNDRPAFQESDIDAIRITASKTLTRTVKVPREVFTGVPGEKPIEEQVDNIITYNIGVSFTDTDLINSLNVTPIDSVFQAADYSAYIDSQKSQNQEQSAGTTELTVPQIDADEAQQNESKTYTSHLESILRTIQLRTFNSILEVSKSSNLTNVYEVPFIDKKNKDLSTFVSRVFSNGSLSGLIEYLIGNREKETLSGFLKEAYYGFNTSIMMGNEEDAKKYEISFEKLMSAYVIPYMQNQSVVEGGDLKYPSYIPLGFFLMILNHCSLLYEEKSGKQLVYIDYNPNSNLCLTNDSMLSTNPYRFMIPFEGTIESYKAIFDQDLITGNSIRPITGSNTIALWDNKKNDGVSKTLPPFRLTPEDQNNKFNAYRGKTLNALVCIDYLLQLIKTHARQDESNSVYVKSLIEEIISDMNKTFGNFNLFRLAYNDQTNCYYITDDQLIPGNNQILPTQFQDLPLFGLKSIAHNLEIKTEISTKLANMLAISANADIGNRATAGVDASSFNITSGSFIDRYKPNVLGSQKSVSRVDGANDGRIAAADQFNTSIDYFYGRGENSEDRVSFATNYYIERMARVKNDDTGTRATALIPVSLNFTTDGISGLSMGQAFTVDDALLPYTYTSNLSYVGKKDNLRTLGFVVVGLDHTIESNQWKTNVRANMYYLKSLDQYTKKVVSTNDNTGAFIVSQIDSGGLDTSVDVSSLVNRQGFSILKQELLANDKFKANKYLIAAILATAGGESGYVSLEESRQYDLPRFREIFTKFSSVSDDRIIPFLKGGARNNEFFNFVYGNLGSPNSITNGNNQPGDGEKYVGRGFIGITGKDNYKKINKIPNEDILANPTRLKDTTVAAKATIVYYTENLKSSTYSNLSDSVLDAVLIATGGSRDSWPKKRSIFKYILDNNLV